MALVPRITEKGVFLDALAQLFVDNPTRGLAFEMRMVWEDLEAQLYNIVDAIEECFGKICAGDIDGDGTVDGADLAVLLGSWGACPAPCAADVDGNGVVDGVDLATLLGGWGNCGD